jgi:hypothetical protein
LKYSKQVTKLSNKVTLDCPQDFSPMLYRSQSLSEQQLDNSTHYKTYWQTHWLNLVKTCCFYLAKTRFACLEVQTFLASYSFGCKWKEKSSFTVKWGNDWKSIASSKFQCLNIFCNRNKVKINTIRLIGKKICHIESQILKS